MVFDYIGSWMLNFIIIAVIVGFVDEFMHNEIEEHQVLGAFLIIVVPTILEFASWQLVHQPFLANLF